MDITLEKRQCQECGSMFYVEAEASGTRTEDYYHCVSCGEKNSERIGKGTYKQ